MIDEIHVRDVALIRDATLQPGVGLTVLTGETGAGKTALLSACKLLMGERAEASMVREGADAAVVEGRLFAGARDTEGFTVVRRLGADGRTRIKLDGGIASVRELAARVSPLIDLCGQHEHQRLLDPASHIDMVDAWSATTIVPALTVYQNALHAARDAAPSLPVSRKHPARRGAGLKRRGSRLSASMRSTRNPVSSRN